MFAAQIAPATLADVVAEVRATALAIVAGDPRGDSVVERALTTVAAANHLSPSTYRLAALSAVVKGCSDVVPVADETLEGMLLLPFDERAALVLVGLVGLSAEDAAAVLETDVAAVIIAAERGILAANTMKAQES